MKSFNKDYLVKFARFNQWEKEYEANKTEQQRISEFFHLFELALQLPADIREKAHREHMKNLIADQKRLGKVKNKKVKGKSQGQAGKRFMVLNIAGSFTDAEQWDIEQQISMTPNERLKVLKILQDRVYGKDARDIRECQLNI